MKSEDAVTTAGSAAGLRERRRRTTRHEVADAAITLFERNGVHGTTVDGIAKAAGISTRTFFRYASSKEKAVFLRDDGVDFVLPHMLERVRDGEPAGRALEGAWRAMLDDFDSSPDQHRHALRLYHLLHAEPALLSIALARDAEQVNNFTEALLTAAPAQSEFAARTIATTIATVVRLAFDEWTRRADRGKSCGVRPLYDEVRTSVSTHFAR